MPLVGNYHGQGFPRGRHKTREWHWKNARPKINGIFGWSTECMERLDNEPSGEGYCEEVREFASAFVPLITAVPTGVCCSLIGDINGLGSVGLLPAPFVNSSNAASSRWTL